MKHQPPTDFASSDAVCEHPVWRVIAERKRSGSLPGKRDDRYKIGLAVEGGGMRAAWSAGALAALERLGLFDAFDAVYGNSAGAVNAAYFVARQSGEEGMSVYYENINNSRFISKLRFFYGRPIISLEYLLDNVVVNQKPLDWRQVLASSVPLKVVATSVSRVERVLLEGFRSREEFFAALRASARIPLFAGPPVPYRDDLLIDGGLFDSHTVHSAEADGCTHILALPTCPPGRVPPMPGPIVHWMLKTYCGRYSPQLAAAYCNRWNRYRETAEGIWKKTAFPASEPYTLGLQLSPHEQFDILERRSDILVAATQEGFEAALSAFEPALC